jgi:hypothetical protein
LHILQLDPAGRLSGRENTTEEIVDRRIGSRASKLDT